MILGAGTEWHRLCTGLSMMRMGVMLMLGLLAGGCAAGRGPNVQNEPTMPSPAHWTGPRAPASALVFDPPVARAEPAIGLGRAARQRAAFVGYDQLTTTFFHIRVDDRHSSDWTDRYQRRAVIEQVGARHR